MCQFDTYRFSLCSTFLQTGISYYFRVINTSPNQELITIGRSLYHCHIFCKRKGQFVGDFLYSSFKLSVVNISRLKNEFNPVIVTLNDQFVIDLSRIITDSICSTGNYLHVIFFIRSKRKSA